MKRIGKSVLDLVVFSLLLAALAPAFAKSGGRDHPSRPIRVIVAFSAGTASSTVARAMSDELAKQMGASVVIENREGAGGNIGHIAAARAAPTPTRC